MERLINSWQTNAAATNWIQQEKEDTWSQVPTWIEIIVSALTWECSFRWKATFVWYLLWDLYKQILDTCITYEDKFELKNVPVAFA